MGQNTNFGREKTKVNDMQQWHVNKSTLGPKSITKAKPLLTFKNKEGCIKD